MKLDDRHVQKWLEEGVITKKQAAKMLADLNEDRKESSSNKLIIFLSTIGAAFVGIGAILFIASNWELMSDFTKTAIMFGSTFSAFYLGFYMKFSKIGYPKVGASLIFLSALLLGASIFILAQTYNVNANEHWLLLLWLIGVLPLTYGLRTTPITTLSALLFYTWFTTYFFQKTSMMNGGDSVGLIILYILSAVLIFSLGGIHFFWEGTKKIGRIYRIFGIHIVLFGIFLLTFQEISGEEFALYFETSTFTNTFISAFALLGILTGTINLFFNPEKSRENKYIYSSALGILFLTVIFYFFPSESGIYSIIYNLVMIGVILMLFILGSIRHDINMVNMGMLWIIVFTLARYFDFFWDLLEKSQFFTIGGIILVLGGLAFERKRKEFKKEFKK